MRLHTLLRQFDPSLAIAELADVELTGIQEDSRLLASGNLFIARGGTNTDGARFVADAVARGAAAVLSQSPLQNCPIPHAVLPELGSALSRLANLFHHNLSQSIRVLGVTGTNGKTTTAYLMRQILNHARHKCGMVGTVEIDDGASTRQATMTTPSAVDVARLLGAMRDNACQAFAIEVSSHALHQDRVSGVGFAAAGFTNLTGDHQDYHQTMEQYAQAKARLFSMLDDQAVAVVNADDPYSPQMVQSCRARVLRFGLANHADWRADDVVVNSQGSNFILHSPDGRIPVRMRLIGKHNIENALLAAALVGETFGLPVSQIAAALHDAAGAPGRLQNVRLEGQLFAVLVDYAHTDDALKNVLSALKPLCRGKLRVLFGCGGDRDPTKRPRMARIAEELADAVYVTSDNPRTEDAASIIAQIVKGFHRPQAVVIDPDRRSAIRKVIGDACAGDVCLLAGKGHENYQIVGVEKRHFDDVEEATAALRVRLAESR